jgi:histidinol-phosphate aminotransferase
MANGSDEVLNNLIRPVPEGQDVGYVHPSYSYYSTLAETRVRSSAPTA